MKNIHKAKFILIGLLIGLMVSSFFAYADEIQQFILTKVNYPVVVNNQEYTNAELPVLNYQGNTYVPLKAVGNLLEADVKWNAELNQVEIKKNTDISNLDSQSDTKPEENYEFLNLEEYNDVNENFDAPNAVKYKGKLYILLKAFAVKNDIYTGNDTGFVSYNGEDNTLTIKYNNREMTISRTDENYYILVNSRGYINPDVINELKDN